MLNSIALPPVSKTRQVTANSFEDEAELAYADSYRLSQSEKQAW